MKIRLLNCLFLGCLTLLSGCIGTARFYKDYIVMPEGDQAINSLEYDYLGSAGPDSLNVRDNQNIIARLAIESGHFPQKHELDDLNLNEKQWKWISNQAEDSLRDYLGDVKKVVFITMKIVSDEEIPKTYLIDIQVKGKPGTLVEHQVRRGFLILNRDIVLRSGQKRLYALQKSAMRSRLGIWKHISASNPSWHD